MNTPTHLIISHAILGSKVKELTKKENWAIFLGAFLPDAAIYILFFYALAANIPMDTVWNELYFTEFWTNFVDYFNSIPITLVLVLIGVWKKWRWMWLYGASSMLHIIADFFTHSSDAHQHFLPLSDWRFISPVSYYEPDKFGGVVGVIEIIIFLAAAYFVRKQIKSPKWRLAFTIIYGIWIALSITLLAVFLIIRPEELFENQ